MAGNQELLASIEMFNNSLKEFTVGQVLSGAREQLAQLQTQNIDASKKQEVMQNFSNELALRLGAASGGNAALVEGIASRFGLSVPQQAHFSMQEKELAQQAQLRREATSSRLLGQQLNLQAQQIQRQAKAEEKQQNSQRLYQSQFNQRASKSLDAAMRAETAIQMLKSSTSVGDASVRNFLARASGEVGALTEADKEPFGGNSSLMRKISRWQNLQRTGRLPESDREELMALASLLATKSRADVDNHARLVSEQMSGNLGIPQENAYQLIYPKGGQLRGSNQNTPPTDDIFNEPGFSIDTVPSTGIRGK